MDAKIAQAAKEKAEVERKSLEALAKEQGKEPASVVAEPPAPYVVKKTKNA